MAGCRGLVVDRGRREHIKSSAYSGDDDDYDDDNYDNDHSKFNNLYLWCSGWLGCWRLVVHRGRRAVVLLGSGSRLG
jgi:hypothetical protein